MLLNFFFRESNPERKLPVNMSQPTDQDHMLWSWHCISKVRLESVKNLRGKRRHPTTLHGLEFLGERIKQRWSRMTCTWKAGCIYNSTRTESSYKSWEWFWVLIHEGVGRSKEAGWGKCCNPSTLCLDPPVWMSN